MDWDFKHVNQNIYIGVSNICTVVITICALKNICIGLSNICIRTYALQKWTYRCKFCHMHSPKLGRNKTYRVVNITYTWCNRHMRELTKAWKQPFLDCWAYFAQQTFVLNVISRCFSIDFIIFFFASFLQYTIIVCRHLALLDWMSLS